MSANTAEKTCQHRIDEHLPGRIAQVAEWLEAEREGEEPDEMFLSVEYVVPEVPEGETGTCAPVPFFRLLMSYGGPSDEFRIYASPVGLSCGQMVWRCWKVEYVFLDWFDGAVRELSGSNLDSLLALFMDWDECGVWQGKLDELN